jgi:hypothetical protein
MRPRHPSKEIERVIKLAEGWGWVVEMSNGHAWAHIKCKFNQRGGCFWPIWSTPKNPTNFAKTLLDRVKKCPH